MFRKLVSNLSFSPGLINQFAFYAKRLRKEESIRKTGFVLTALAIVVQTFAIISPPKPSLAASDTDLIYGGGTKQRIIDAYLKNTDGIHSDIRAIFDYFGIGEAELRAATDNVTIRTSAENDFWTVGRRQRTKYPTSDQVTIAPANLGFKVYYRNWHRAWDTYAYSDHAAIRGIAKNGKPFWIAKDCGNITTQGKWPVEPQPDLSIRKEVISPLPASKDQEVKFKIAYANTGYGTAADVKISDVLPPELQFVRLEPTKSGQTFNGQLIEFRHDNSIYAVLPGQTAGEVTLVAKVIKTSSSPICNSVNITAAGGLRETANACITTVIPQPDAVCSRLTKTPLSRTKFRFEATAQPINGATFNSYLFDFGDGKQETVTTTASSASTEHEYSKTGVIVAKVTVDSSVGKKTSEACSVTFSILPPSGKPMVGREKLVSNLTANELDKTKLKAKAGDELEYKLTARNVGDAEQKDFEFGDEDLADVMDYATVTAISDNGTVDTRNKFVRWDDKITIAAGASVTRTIKVKVVSPIPTTAPSVSDASTFDLKMVNIFGNQTVEVDLEKPVVNKVTENVQRLPSTGPGTSVLMSFVVFTVIGYFYARSRLLAKEATLIKEEFTAGAL